MYNRKCFRNKIKGMKKLRLNYIDNLRNLTILLLFPIHTFMIWNDFDTKFYIWNYENKFLSTLIVLVNPWFMPILFVIAGISAKYALKKYSIKKFILQRIRKLVIPFIFGTILLVPFQTFFARKYFYNYNGTLLDNFKYFFTHLTDLSGYDGSFTPGHLWFILFLFIISLLSLILFYFIPYQKIKNKIKKMPVIIIIFLFVPIWIMYYLGNFNGFSIGKYLALFLIGYYVLSNSDILNKLERNFNHLALLCFFGTLLSVFMYYEYSYYGDLWINFIGWISILTFIILGKKFLNHKSILTNYFNNASFPIYILHQSILVTWAYYIINAFDNLIIQIISICVLSFLTTIIAYHLIKLFPFVRKIIGIK